VKLLRAAKHGTDAGDELAGIERLGNVIVSANFQAEDAIDGFSAGGEKNDGHAGVRAQRLEQFKAGAAGKHNVKNDDVVLAGDGGIEAGTMIENGENLKSLVLKEALEQGDKSLIVVDNEYTAHGIHSAGRSGKWL
jgi:hypothetical protein